MIAARCFAAFAITALRFAAATCIAPQVVHALLHATRAACLSALAARAR